MTWDGLSKYSCVKLRQCTSTMCITTTAKPTSRTCTTQGCSSKHYSMSSRGSTMIIKQEYNQIKESFNYSKPKSQMESKLMTSLPFLDLLLVSVKLMSSLTGPSTSLLPKVQGFHLNKKKLSSSLILLILPSIFNKVFPIENKFLMSIARVKLFKSQSLLRDLIQFPLRQLKK